MYVATRVIEIKIKVQGNSALNVDAYCRKLRADIADLAKQKTRQRKAEVTLMEINPWGIS